MSLSQAHSNLLFPFISCRTDLLSPRSGDGDNKNTKYDAGNGLNDYSTAKAVGARPLEPDYGPEYRDVGASPHPGHQRHIGSTSAPFGSGPGFSPVQMLQNVLRAEQKAPGVGAGGAFNPTYEMPTEGQRAPISPLSAKRTKFDNFFRNKL